MPCFVPEDERTTAGKGNLPNANKNNTNNMKSTCQTQSQPSRTKHEVYSTRSHWGSCLVCVGCAGVCVGCAGLCIGCTGVRDGFTSGGRGLRYQHVGIGNAKLSRWGSKLL